MQRASALHVLIKRYAAVTDDRSAAQALAGAYFLPRLALRSYFIMLCASLHVFQHFLRNSQFTSDKTDTGFFARDV